MFQNFGKEGYINVYFTDDEFCLESDVDSKK